MRRRFSSFIRETGAYLILLGVCAAVVVTSPYFLGQGKEWREPSPTEQPLQAEPSLIHRPVNDRGDTALHVAVREGNTRRIVELLAANADPSFKNHDGVTPLDLAHARGQEDIIGLLTSGILRDSPPEQERE